jgi:hypothetical protein
MKRGETMKTRALLGASVLVLTIALPAIAASPAECEAKIGEARTALLDLLGGKNDPDQQKKVKDTADAVDPCIDGLKAPPGKDAQLNELKIVWREFKTTRETQLVPAILAGKTDEAKNLATGIQQERLNKINSLVGQLE